MGQIVKVIVTNKEDKSSLLSEETLVSVGTESVKIHLSKEELEKTDKTFLYRKFMQAGKQVSQLSFMDKDIAVELENTEYYVWDNEACYAFTIGYRTLKQKNDPLLPKAITEDTQFVKMQKVIAWQRKVIDMPSNKLWPLNYEEYLRELLSIVDSKSLTLTKISGEELEKQNLVGLMTVGNSSNNKPCMYELVYEPTNKSVANLEKEFSFGLVGKGITFDTGGYSLKPSEFMKSMHSDMGGSATVAAAIALAAVREFPKSIKAYLCCAENVVSAEAMKIGDIIDYPNGVSVVVDNTDAEGRLVLADGLIKASKECEYIVDAATLTGAAKYAVGRDYNSVLSLNNELAQKFIASAKEEYELAWQLPFEEFHLGLCKSDLADITNSASGEGLPGATTAAVFLSKFVQDTSKWVHIDLSGSYQKVANSTYNVGAKGHGVRSIVHYLEKV